MDIFTILAIVFIILFFVLLIFWVFLPTPGTGEGLLYNAKLGAVLLVISFIFLLLAIVFIVVSFNTSTTPLAVITPSTPGTGVSGFTGITGPSGSTGGTGNTGLIGTVKYGDIVMLRNTFTGRYADPCGVTDCDVSSLNVGLRTDSSYNQNQGRLNKLRKWQILSDSSNLGLPIKSGDTIFIKSIASNPGGINPAHNLGICNTTQLAMVGPNTNNVVWAIQKDPGNVGPTGFILYGENINLLTSITGPTRSTGTSNSSDCSSEESRDTSVKVDNNSSLKSKLKSNKYIDESVYVLPQSLHKSNIKTSKKSASNLNFHLNTKSKSICNKCGYSETYCQCEYSSSIQESSHCNCSQCSGSSNYSGSDCSCCTCSSSCGYSSFVECVECGGSSSSCGCSGSSSSCGCSGSSSSCGCSGPSSSCGCSGSSSSCGCSGSVECVECSSSSFCTCSSSKSSKCSSSNTKLPVSSSIKISSKNSSKESSSKNSSYYTNKFSNENSSQSSQKSNSSSCGCSNSSNSIPDNGSYLGTNLNANGECGELLIVRGYNHSSVWTFIPG